MIRLRIIKGAVFLAIVVCSASASAQQSLFPKGVFGFDDWSDDFKAKWYSEELQALGEPSLSRASENPEREVYRFLWLRSFHRPIAIRLELEEDGSATLTVKVTDGTGGFRPGRLIEATSRPIFREQAQKFLARLKTTKFWDMRTNVTDTPGDDGAQWIIEGVKAGRYHLVDRWSPKEGAVRELGLMMAIGLAQMSIPASEIY